MLTDYNIWTALQMLKKQFPKMGGLQNPVLGTILQFTVASGPFVQILHDGNLHWVTVATPPPLMAADVILYDSLNDRVNSHCEKQISFYFHENPHQSGVWLTPVSDKVE